MVMSRCVLGLPGAVGPVRRVVDLEIVIPAYNEAARLPATLRAAVAYLDERPWRTRIVVVDNGSVDDTAEVVRGVEAGGVDLAVIGCSRAGKGAAVRRGLSAGTAAFVGFVDADLSTPLDTLTEVMSRLRWGAPAVVASRHAPGARFVRAQPLGRRLGGAVFRALARPLVVGVRDTQCGFKFFQRDVVHAALRRCRLTGFAFDVELLRQVQAAGRQVVEIPVAWTDDARTTFHPVRDGVATFVSLLRLYRPGVA
ncbi:glycosyl transferase family 2 [Saccharothrix australiensis]|uniref:Glycosyl transferase family 2 n=2 Tax=Saccharothrix australiensis TaxID=2072 RepID=A0A495W169_9PSEU|nr:glycosyl transferase family 2 [Saccharothrix australiensis]